MHDVPTDLQTHEACATENQEVVVHDGTSTVVDGAGGLGCVDRESPVGRCEPPANDDATGRRVVHTLPDRRPPSPIGTVGDV